LSENEVGNECPNAAAEWPVVQQHSAYGNPPGLGPKKKMKQVKKFTPVGRDFWDEGSFFKGTHEHFGKMNEVFIGAFGYGEESQPELAQIQLGFQVTDVKKPLVAVKVLNYKKDVLIECMYVITGHKIVHTGDKDVVPLKLGTLEDDNDYEIIDNEGYYNEYS
jgi:hypothetical protein